MNFRRRIYVDLDGVLADFYRYVRMSLGASYQFVPPATSWGHLDQVDHLFLQLDVLPDALELWQGLEQYGERTILTAAPLPTGKLATAREDKTKWVRQHVCKTSTVLIADKGELKAAWAYPGDILIDDQARNINAWTKAGGIGILHTSAQDTLATLQRLDLDPDGIMEGRQFQPLLDLNILRPSTFIRGATSQR